MQATAFFSSVTCILLFHLGFPLSVNEDDLKRQRQQFIVQIRVSLPAAVSLTSLRAVIDRSHFFDVIAAYCEK